MPLAAFTADEWLWFRDYQISTHNAALFMHWVNVSPATVQTDLRIIIPIRTKSL
jgi:hypothetical protein